MNNHSKLHSFLLSGILAVFLAAPASAQAPLQGGVSPPVAESAALSAGSNTAGLSAPGSFTNGRGIVIYNAGAPTSLANAPGAPTATVNGYAGANGGPTTSYEMAVAACDASWGCTATSPASAAAIAAPVLSEPHTAGASGNNVAWSVSPVSGAWRYVWWRSTNGGSTWQLWRVTDGPTFTDWQNVGGVSTQGRWTNTPLAAPTNEDFVSTVTGGGGTTTLTLADNAPSTGSFTAWPDDTAQIDAAYSTANQNGGSVYCSTGYYKVRSITMLPNVAFRGSFWDGQQKKGCVIYGTPGDDIFALSSSPGDQSPYRLEDISTIGGRNTIYLSAIANFTPTSISIERLSASEPENATLAFFASVEELYVEQSLFDAGRFGFDLEGQVYLQKSAIRDSTFEAQVSNGIYTNTNTVVFGYATFDRDIFQAESQDAISFNSPIAYGSVLFSGMTTEADGQDFRGAATTASCSNGSDSYTLASVTGLAVGQDYSVKGCAASLVPIEGTICAISGSTVTLMDPTCTTPVAAGRTTAGQSSTSAIFDDLYTNGYLNIDSSVIGNAGRYSANAPAGLNVRDSGFGGFGGLLDASGSSNLRGIDGEWIRPRPFYNFVAPGQDASTETMSSGYNAATHTTPLGGDFDLGLVDSAGNGSGTYGELRVIKNDGNRTTVFSVDSSGDVTARGTINGGVSCSGVPSSQFSVVGGIVTHC